MQQNDAGDGGDSSDNHNNDHDDVEGDDDGNAKGDLDSDGNGLRRGRGPRRQPSPGQDTKTLQYPLVYLEYEAVVFFVCDTSATVVGGFLASSHNRHVGLLAVAVI